MHSNRKKLSFIVFDDSEVPKYFQIKKTLIRKLFLWMPTLLGLFIIITLVLALFIKRILFNQKAMVPLQVKELSAEINKRDAELAELKKQNKFLNDKILLGTSSGDTEIFQYFQLPIGYKSLEGMQQVRIEQPKETIKNSKIQFQFELYNNNENDSRLSGHIFVFRYQESQIQIYPNQAKFNEEIFLPISEGEYFSVARFREVIAEFPAPASKQESYYKIFIFNRFGELLITKKFGPFSI